MVIIIISIIIIIVSNFFIRKINLLNSVSDSVSRNNNNTYFIEQLWGINELIHIKCMNNIYIITLSYPLNACYRPPFFVNLFIVSFLSNSLLLTLSCASGNRQDRHFVYILTWPIVKEFEKQCSKWQLLGSLWFWMFALFSIDSET